MKSAKDRYKMMPADSLEMLPVTASIRISSRIRDITGDLQAGCDTPRPVAVAYVAGTAYVIDGLDLLEAYRQASMPLVPCVVSETESVADALALHMGLCCSLPANPFHILEAAGWIEKHGGTVPVLDGRFRRLAELPLAAEIPRIFDTWIKKLAARLDTIPSFWHIFLHLSQVPADRQGRALESVMAFVYAMGTAPDPSTLRSILRQFAPRTQGSTDHVEAIDAPAGRPAAAAPRDVAAEHDKCLDHTRRISCRCGEEWYVDTKSEAVRRVQDTDNLTVLTDVCGDPVYPVPAEAAKHLDMGNTPVYHYVVDVPFPAVLLSARTMDTSVLRRVAGALHAAGHKTKSATAQIPAAM